MSALSSLSSLLPSSGFSGFSSPSGPSGSNGSSVPWLFLFGILVVAVVVWFVSRSLWSMPRYRREEGFEALKVFRVPEAEGLLRTVDRASDSAEFAEFSLLLQKMGALQADLEGSGVDATRGIAFDTAHDRMAVAEVCGMCFTHSIAPRDMEIVIQTWRDRGSLLLRKLCTLANLREVDVVGAEKMFGVVVDRTYEVAKTRCLVTVAGESPGEVRGVETAATRAYEGRASGWNGTI